MGGRLRDRLKIEDGLRRALERDELRLVLPADRGPRAARASSPSRRSCAGSTPSEGLLAPGPLPARRRAARPADLGDRRLGAAPRLHRGRAAGRRACASASTSPRASSARPGFAERVARTIAAAGVAPERIALEITETTLMEGGERGDRGPRGARAARRAGLPRRLRHRLLVAHPARAAAAGRDQARPRLRRRARRASATAGSSRRRSRIGRAAELGVVAEGVETEDQLELLRACGCRFVQGYLLGRPAPPEQVAAQLTG